VGCSAIVGKVSLKVITLLWYNLLSDCERSGCFFVNAELSEQVIEDKMTVFNILSGLFVESNLVCVHVSVWLFKCFGYFENGL
jgi:hypothetical protein